MAYETVIDHNQIIIKSKYDSRNDVKIESHEYPVNSEQHYRIEYRVHSANGFDSWNAPDKHYFSLTQAIKYAQNAVKEFDKEYEWALRKQKQVNAE